jgi:hypothetical protein
VLVGEGEMAFTLDVMITRFKPGLDESVIESMIELW